jgi:hypothetical protein
MSKAKELAERLSDIAEEAVDPVELNSAAIDGLHEASSLLLSQENRIAELDREIWQLKQALGYPIPAEFDTPQNPFKCGVCDARSVDYNRIAELEKALEQIAKQKLRVEMNEDPIEGIDADWEHGYECCVQAARSALTPSSPGEEK